MRKKVLMLTATLGYGGSEASFLRLATFLSNHADVTIALMARDYGSEHYSSAQTDVDFPIVILDGDAISGGSIACKLLRWWRMFFSLKALKNENDATVSFLSGPNLLNALAFCSGVTVVSERGSKRYHLGLSRKIKFLWLRILDPITYRYADKVVTVSNGYTREVKDVAGKSLAHKVFAIEGGIDANQLLDVSQESPDEDIESFVNEKTLVFCSRLDVGKGIDLLLPIIADLLKADKNLKLLVIGDGPLMPRLVEICQFHRISYTDSADTRAAIFFAGYRQNPIRNFKLCIAYCFPSLHEGLGNALIEAVASGIPVIAADCNWGPRSVLGGDDNESYIFPAKLSYGTLLPMINTDEGKRLWFDAIKQHLAGDDRSAAEVEKAKQSVKRFDINQTGPLWLDTLGIK